MDKTYKDIFVVGDIHGCEWPIHACADDHKDSLIIQVGDYNVGYRHILKDQSRMNKTSEILAANNNELLIIRGNHDDPKYFVDGCSLNRPNITLIPDYTYRTINGKVFLFVGGATSIDRQMSIIDKDYWIGEEFQLREDYETLPECDVLVTHTAPEGAFPFGGVSHLSMWFANDKTLEHEIVQERKDLRKLFEHVKPKIAHFYGHFHESSMVYFNSGSLDGTSIVQRCLNVNEVVKIKL